jgi:hypothetical protein
VSRSARGAGRARPRSRWELALAARVVRRLDPSTNDGRSPRDRFLGGSFGALRGMLLAMLVVYAAMWADALRATGNVAVLPEIGESAAADLTGGVVRSAVETALDADDPTARFAARFAASPGETAAQLQSVIEDPHFLRLRDDADFWSAVEVGDLDSALDRSSFRGLQGDAQLRHALADLGIVPEEAGSDGEAFRQAFGEALGELGPRLHQLRTDPALQELIHDPEIAAMVQSGNTLGVLTDPRFRELVTRIGETPR